VRPILEHRQQALLAANEEQWRVPLRPGGECWGQTFRAGFVEGLWPPSVEAFVTVLRSATKPRLLLNCWLYLEQVHGHEGQFLASCPQLAWFIMTRAKSP
jgi:hypothetical protein